MRVIYLLPCLLAALTLRADAQEVTATSAVPARWSYAAEQAARNIEDTNVEKSSRRLWKWSMVTLVACTAFDAATSINNSEGNPMLRSSNGQFGYKGLLLKSALATGTIAFEFHFSKRTRMYKP